MSLAQGVRVMNGTVALAVGIATAAVLFCAVAAAAPNPVLPETADCGVMRFNGEYYLMGVYTKGAMYVSPDLVTWRGHGGRPNRAYSLTGSGAGSTALRALIEVAASNPTGMNKTGSGALAETSGRVGPG